MAGAHRRLGGPGYALVERARDTIARHGMIARGDVVLAALSGGPDSTALVDVLARLEGSLGLAVHIAHVDHGLAGDSAEVASRLASAAAESGFEVHVVRAPDLAGPNLHARAREFRYGFFHTVAGQIGAARIATGHTLDDRAETTLARLVHGADTGGIAGIPPVDGARIRPLIEARRAETRAYCIESGLSFVDDPANDDPRFERAAIRNEIVPAITERFGAGAVASIARSAERLGEDAAALDGIADRLWPGLASEADSGAGGDEPAAIVRLPLDELLKLPRALRRRILEHAVGRVRDRAGGIEAVLEALEGEAKPGARFDVADGIEITLTREGIVVARRMPA